MYQYIFFGLFVFGKCAIKPQVDIQKEVVIDSKNPTKSQKETRVEPILANEESYAGFIQISNHSQHFFWFFKCEKKSAPLIIWLQGQPGLSSLYGLFYECGPYQVKADSNISKREHAWTDHYNVLFLDSTTECGFSHTVGEKHETYGREYSDHLPNDIHKMILQFFDVFSEYVENEIYLAGASASSKIIPLLAQCILYSNKNYGYEYIKLRGLLIGGGLLFDSDYQQYAENLFHLGIVDSHTATSMNRPQHIISALIRSGNYASVMEFIGTQITLQIKKAGFKSIYDIRQTDPIVNTELENLVSTSAFRNRIHVGDRRFKHQNQILITYLLQPLHEIFCNLLKKTRILLYNAQFDFSASYIKAMMYISQLPWSGTVEFHNQSKNKWFLNKQLMGHWKSAQNLTHVFIRNAGHMVGMTQPQALLNMIQNFINGRI